MTHQTLVNLVAAVIWCCCQVKNYLMVLSTHTFSAISLPHWSWWKQSRSLQHWTSTNYDMTDKIIQF